jgi:FkbM family methyltransferase
MSLAENTARMTVGTVMNRVRQSLRRSALRVLRRFNAGDITIRHHYTGGRLTIHSFMHRAYWFHGKNRERDTMALFKDLIASGDLVIEVGGHVGYVSLYLAQLVGETGRLIVFEPGPNNLPYIRRNVSGQPRITLVEAAMSDTVGTERFYLESLSGLNNSLVPDFDMFEANLKSSGINRVDQSVVTVRCTTGDSYIREHQLAPPAFVKIDVEGAELLVLRGLEHTLTSPNISLMVEVTKSHEEVFRLLRAVGFRLFTSGRREVNTVSDMGNGSNIFCVKNNNTLQRLMS